MPLFSEHIANMYYGSSSPYTGSPYSSYTSSISPLGSSYSASYLNPGGSYSNHSSLGSYSRAPISSRWITSSGRNYSPMLSTISERGSASPVRINSPRRLPLSSRTYGTPTYTPRPVNINTADIDVSRDKYRRNVEPQRTPLPQAKENSKDDSENSPFMPRVDGKPETGIDSSPGGQRSTIKRGRTVVRLYTIKRKERDSPRKPTEEQQPSDDTKDQEAAESVEEDTKKDEKEFMKWREKLSDDLTYKDKKEKKTLGAKLVEKFILKDSEKDSEIPAKVQRKETAPSEVLPVVPPPDTNMAGNKCLDRRCSMELLAEQANLLDSLIRGENLSTATLDLSKVGVNEPKNNLDAFESMKRRKSNEQLNPLKTTKSDHSLHDSLKPYKDVRDPRNFSNKRRSIKKSSSGSSLRRLDSITEFPKETSSLNLPAIEESRTSIKQENSKQKPKPKLKAKITASVEVSPPMSPLKFIVEKVTVEEKPRVPKKKEIIYRSEVEETPTTSTKPLEQVSNKYKDQNNIKKSSNVNSENALPTPESESENFWDKIGKRETVYLIKRKKNNDEAKEKHKRALFWFPEEEEAENSEGFNSKIRNDLNINTIGGNDIPKLINDEIGINNITESTGNINEDNIKTSDYIISTDEVQKDDPKIVKVAQNISIASESISSTKDNNLIETSNTKLNSTSKEILNEGPGPKLTKQTAFNIEETDIVVGDICAEITNIGKSASLDIISENKVKTTGLKKAKSEKSKKALQIPNKTETLQPLLPKPNLKTKALEKPSIQEESEDFNKNKIAEESYKIIIDELETPKAPCPIHPFGLQKMKEPTEQSKANVPVDIINNKEEVIEKVKAQAEDANLEMQSKVDSEAVVKEKGESSSNDKNLTDNIIELIDRPKAVIIEKTQSKVNEKQELSNNIQEPSVVLKTEKHQNNITEKNEISNQIKEPVTEPKPIVKTQSNDRDKQEVVKEQEKENKSRPPCPIHGLQKGKEQIGSGKNSLNLPKDLLSKLESNSPKAIDDKLDDNNRTSSVKSLNEKPSASTEFSKLIETKEVESINGSIPKTIVKPVAKLSKKKISAKELQQDNKTDSSVKSNKVKVKTVDPKLKPLNKKISGEKTKDNKAVGINDVLSQSEQPSTSSGITSVKQDIGIPITALQKSSEINSAIESDAQIDLKTLDVPENRLVLESQDIPNEKTEFNTDISQEKTGEENKAENTTLKDQELEKTKEEVIVTPKKPVKEEKAVKPLIATPRPLQRKSPQVIHSSDSSDSSSEEESSEEEDASDSSADSAEFYECDNNPDGRTSTGSNDSGFDSSAPASPATFSQIKKDCDVNCHRKCEKLTANLCGVNQRLLVEALASRTASKKGGEASAATSSATPAQNNNTDILEQELEQSTAYDIFKKTGRFTPPARSIPRFRKYTVEDFQFIKVLGKGSFGKVLLAELRDTEYYYAVKCLKKDVVLEDDDVECTLIERKVLALGTNHPYLCHLFATFQTDSHLFFVMEYLNGGDLMFHIQQSGRFPEARARLYAAEIVSGLKFLHKRGIVYRDLKLDNILLDFEGHVRIADFGMCKLQIYLDKTADTFCGTPDYMAPEIIKGLKYNQTVDWWSFGVLLYEMLIGQSPFSGCDEDELFWSICNEMPSYPRFLSHESLTILTRLLDKDARTRLGGTECMYGDIREQEFFHPIHWDRLERRELEAPFRPRVRHPMDTQYFDRAFTGERPRLTAVEPHVLRSMDQEPFRGFSYTNPNTTDR